MNRKLREDFKEAVIAMSKEFDEKEGFVTCEVSAHKDSLSELEQFILDNTEIKFGSWVFMECETCVGHNGEGYVHVSIERPDVVVKIEASDNHIKTIK
jgi:hypothetical protein